MKKGCRYNTCSICAFADECEVYKENKLLGYEIKRLENELQFARKMAIHKHKQIKELQEELAVLKAHMRG